MACSEAPGLVTEKNRLKAFGGQFLGIIGDVNHSYGYHLCNPGSGDYSTFGAANKPAGDYACAIDIGMTTWPAGRTWLTWLITEIREDRITGIAEVIGSFDGKTVRYWSDTETPTWQQVGVPYTGSGHDTWTHVAIYRSTATQDHKLLDGWGLNGQGGNTNGGGTTMPNQFDPIKDVILYNTPQGTRLGDVWGSTLGNAQGASTGVAQANGKLDELLSRASNITLSGEDIAALAQLIAAALAENLAARIKE